MFFPFAQNPIGSVVVVVIISFPVSSLVPGMFFSIVKFCMDSVEKPSAKVLFSVSLPERFEATLELFYDHFHTKFEIIPSLSLENLEQHSRSPPHYDR